MCRIYNTFKKEFRCFIVLKKEKDTKVTNDKIFVQSNMSTLDLQKDIDAPQDNKKEKRV